MGAWPVILLAGGTLVVLVTSYVVLRVLGILSWRALGFAYHSVKMVRVRVRVRVRVTGLGLGSGSGLGL